MKIAKLKNTVQYFSVSNCMIIEPWYARFPSNYFLVHLKSIHGVLVGTRGHGRR